jgi:hypothetical protein
MESASKKYFRHKSNVELLKKTAMAKSQALLFQQINYVFFSLFVRYVLSILKRRQQLVNQSCTRSNHGKILSDTV